MSDTLTDTSSPIVGGPLEDDTSAPVRTTLGESLGATATQAWNALPTVGLSRQAQYQAMRGSAPTADYTAGIESAPYNPDTEDLPHTIQNQPIDPETINAQVKRAGATLTPFTHPESQPVVDAMIAENRRSQKAASVIANSAAGIIATPARFAVGALVSLADPTNDMAMMIPGAPEAWAARAIEEAGGGVLARTGVRAGVGALQGAAGMAALQPLAAVQASQDHEDYSWGEALRNVAFGAAIGTAGGALHGILSRAGPETTEVVAKAATAQVMADAPRGVDVEAILDHDTAPATADQSARDMASRAQNPTDPELVRTQRAAAQTIDTAPKLEGIDTSKDTAEASAMLADKKAEYDGLVASGELAEHPSLADEGKEHEDYGKAVDAYGKTCAFGG